MIISSLKKITTTCILVLCGSVNFAYCSELFNYKQCQESATKQLTSVSDAVGILKTFVQSPESEAKTQKLRNISKHLISSKHMQTVKSLDELLKKNSFATLMPLIIFCVYSNNINIDLLEKYVKELLTFYDLKNPIKTITDIVKKCTAINDQEFLDDAQKILERLLKKANELQEKLQQRQDLNIQLDTQAIVSFSQQQLQYTETWLNTIMQYEKQIADICIKINDSTMLKKVREDFSFLDVALNAKLTVEDKKQLSNAIKKIEKATLSFTGMLKSINFANLSQLCKTALNFLIQPNSIDETIIQNLESIIETQKVAFQEISQSPQINTFVDMYLVPCVEGAMQAFITEEVSTGVTKIETFTVDINSKTGTFVISRTYSGEEFRNFCFASINATKKLIQNPFECENTLRLLNLIGASTKPLVLTIPVKFELIEQEIADTTTMEFVGNFYKIKEAYIASFYPADK